MGGGQLYGEFCCFYFSLTHIFYFLFIFGTSAGNIWKYEFCNLFYKIRFKLYCNSSHKANSDEIWL